MSENLAILEKMPQSKKEVKLFAENLINSIQWGEINPLDLDGQLKALEEVVSMVRKSEEMKEGLLAEADKYKEKSFDYGRFSFQKKEVGVKYDFSGCDDQILEHLEKTSEKLNEEIKARKDFLKTIQPGVACFDENGIQLFPPAKTSTSTVITLLK